MKHLIAALALAWASAATYGASPAFPQKPIVAVVPFPPGGSSDMIARIVGPSVNRSLGQQRMIDLGFEVLASTPDYSDKFLAQELARWKHVVTVGKITIE